MKLARIAVLDEEGGYWDPEALYAHAVKFPDGIIWDAVNGLRKDTFPAPTKTFVRTVLVQQSMQVPADWQRSDAKANEWGEGWKATGVQTVFSEPREELYDPKP
jgi:hypothetical protein